MRAPLGKYNSKKLLNLGANRWGLKVGLASSYDITKKLKLEGHVNTWVSTANKEFFHGNTIQQTPILSAQLHLTYIFKPGFWFALAYKVAKHHAIKIAYTSGVSTRHGADFNSVIITYQYMWFDIK